MSVLQYETLISHEAKQYWIFLCCLWSDGSTHVRRAVPTPRRGMGGCWVASSSYSRARSNVTVWTLKLGCCSALSMRFLLVVVG
jgi:hypothetical protein